MYSSSFGAVVDEILADIRKQLASRAYRAANELRNAAIQELSGQRSGRRYRVPHTKGYYTASAPGEPPAVRTGTFRNGWTPSTELSGNVFTSRIENMVTVNGYVLGELLEGGTSRMAPRPHQERILAAALPKIMDIYDEPYS